MSDTAVLRTERMGVDARCRLTQTERRTASRRSVSTATGRGRASLPSSVQVPLDPARKCILVPGVDEVRARRTGRPRRARHFGAPRRGSGRRARGGRDRDRCERGQAARDEYVMWLLWSALSSRVPSQQSGKLTCRRRPPRRVPGQRGIVLDSARGTAQLQDVTLLLCPRRACASPAIIINPTGNGSSGRDVCRL